MKISTPALVGGTFLLLATQLVAQNSGTSHPESLDDTVVVAAPATSTVIVTPQAPALHTRITEPRAADPVSPSTEVYGAYKPYAGGVQSPARALPADPDAGIVTSFPYSENALAEGTLLKARLVGELSTESTRPGSHFIATLSHSVEHNGRVILPVGASLEGRVTSVRGGRRFAGGAAIHLQPETVTLPDGTQYHLTARVTDLNGGPNARVNDEGTIMGGNHTKGHATTLAATTGGGAITGAVLGGGVGAAVGAGIGAGVGTILWLNQDRQQTIPEGTELIFSLNSPMELTPDIARR